MNKGSKKKLHWLLCTVPLWPAFNCLLLKPVHWESQFFCSSDVRMPSSCGKTEKLHNDSVHACLFSSSHCWLLFSWSSSVVSASSLTSHSHDPCSLFFLFEKKKKKLCRKIFKKLICNFKVSLIFSVGDPREVISVLSDSYLVFTVENLQMLDFVFIKICKYLNTIISLTAISHNKKEAHWLLGTMGTGNRLTVGK